MRGARPTVPNAILVHPRYESREVLGEGAQGIVLRVVDREAPSRPLVAKVWRSHAAGDRVLSGEFALLARLRVRGLVRVHDFARDSRTRAPFVVEDFIDGPDAATWVGASSDAAASARLLGTMADVAAALAALHDAGFVHGDLKPEHVRLSLHDGSVRPQAVLLDLGSAVSRAHLAEESAAFTPAFAAPELRAGGRATSASDLYGLGALAWAIATGRPLAPVVSRGGAHPALRDRAGWVQPALADLVEALLAPHPRDRPADALEVLGRLGAVGNDARMPAQWALPPPLGREHELHVLQTPSRSGVRYVTGKSGAGKSHVLREAVTRALLAGQDARLVAFPADVRLAPRLVAYFRGADEAWPFTVRDHARSTSSGGGFDPGGHGRMLLALDDVQAAPRELFEALDGWRCRPKPGVQPEILASSMVAPEGAEVLNLGPLDCRAMADLCRTIGILEGDAIAHATRAADGNPGWLVASAGRVPLTRDTVLDRLRGLSPPAVACLAAIALCGGTAVAAVCNPAGIGELLEASLVTRKFARGSVSYALTSPAVAADLSAALATFEVADRAAEALLALEDADVPSLLAVARAPIPPALREALLERAAACARRECLQSEEADALLALAANPARRDVALLCRLERLTRDAGAGALHHNVLAWLDEAAERDPTARPLALRRRAERAARSGDTRAARSLAIQARDAARAIGDPEAEALALATMGAIALWRADWTDAEASLVDARTRLLTLEGADAEEVARVEHNFGVVALYRGRVAEATLAFERCLEKKRRIGDRAGVRACLLNLGLALGKAGNYDDAVRVLEEAIALARSLGQTAGRAWCLAARAEIEVRRGQPAPAERWIAEAEAIGDGAPPVVRADLLLLRAQVALLEGDGRGAVSAIARIDPRVRAEQALVDTRARVLEAEGHLATLPADRRRAARLAIDALRRARRAELPDLQAEALAAFRAARAKPRAAERAALRYPARVGDANGADDAHWQWLADLAGGRDVEEAALALARIVAVECGAERAFVAALDSAGHTTLAWGVDLDGIVLAMPERRLDAELARAALARQGAMYRRDVETQGGRGSRLAVAGPRVDDALRVLVVAEHRFVVGRFDAVRAEDTRRWVTLAAVLVRLAEAGDGSRSRKEAAQPIAAPSPGESRELGATTAAPLREPHRSFPSLLGASDPMRRALAKLDAAIEAELPVLLVGETGVGKELFARALHEHGRRASAPFVAVNCGAIPEALFEAELFGHARGSFTGAERARPGLIARAEGGTLLLDEVGELPLSRQVVLLRALETRRYRPVGSDEERAFDLRFVAATNRDLENAISQGAFRRDLLYRLNVVEIRIPPLRERPDDIPLLVRAFVKRAGSSAEIAPDALDALTAYAWPGNVRELEHLIQRLVASGVLVVRREHLPRALRSGAASPPKAGRSRRPAHEPPNEHAEVMRALERTRGNISQAARALGLTRQGLKKRMARLGIRSAAASGDGGVR
jgi:DNA-binding NtrC family response regulator